MPQLENCGFPARQTAFERQAYFYPYIKLRMHKKTAFGMNAVLCATLESNQRPQACHACTLTN